MLAIKIVTRRKKSHLLVCRAFRLAKWLDWEIKDGTT
jgi:hypothetical protein